MFQPIQRKNEQPSQTLIQPKLEVGKEDDEHEKEANHVADKVMKMSDPDEKKKKMSAGESGSKIQKMSSGKEEEKMKDEDEGRIQKMSSGKEERKMKDEDEGKIQKMSDESLTINKMSDGNGSAMVAPQNVEQGIISTKGSGQSLPLTTQQELGGKMNADFSDVKIHTDENAVQMNKEVGAKAFTSGDDIYFNSGQYNPESNQGKHLLAHELTHTVQQGGEKKLVQKTGTGQMHEKTGTELRKSDAEIFESDRYWLKKMSGVIPAQTREVINRFTKSKEEQNAVYSILFTKIPALPVTVALAPINVKIPPRAGVKNSTTLFYSFTFAPNQDPPTQVAYPTEVDINFEKEGTKIDDAYPVFANAPATVYAKRNNNIPDWSKRVDASFPGGNREQFFTTHPETKKKINYYLETVSPPLGADKKTPDDNGTVTKTFKCNELVNGNNDEFYLGLSVEFAAGKFNSMTLWYDQNLTDKIKKERDLLKLTASTPSAGYTTKKYADAVIESLQNDNFGTLGYKLGTITGINTISKEEYASVLNAIDSYFETGEKNAEVDAIVPIAQKDYNVYCTLIFSDVIDGKVNVTVKRLGKDTELDALSMDIKNVKGYSENATDPVKLRSWITGRYKGVKETDLPGTSVILVTNKMNQILKDRSGNTGWFSDNYGITVFSDIGKASEELKTALTNSAEYNAALAAMNDTDKADTLTKLTAGVTVFSSDELKVMELSLQPMSDGLIDQYRKNDVKMLRQDTEKEYKNGVVSPTTTGTGGFTLGTTVTILDKATLNDKALFAGGKKGTANLVRPASIGTFTHELGHVAANKITNLKSDFEAFVSTNNIKPFTSYAVDKPTTEFFPEAMRLYLNDPEWLLKNYPELYTWFSTELSKTKLDKR